MASRRLEDLQVPAAKVFEDWIYECTKAGIDVLVYCTYRSAREQNDLYAIGRTVKGEGVTKAKPMGRVVTNARGGDSMHQYGVAIDCVPLYRGKALWNGDLPNTPQHDRLYEKMAAIGYKLGIEWSGNWKKFKEMAHFQYTQGLTLAQLKAGARLKG